MPVQCHQCDNPPCTKACPVGATWKEPDGIVVIDYNWCIGCRFCVVACPYFARRFNWIAPSVPPERINPNQGYLSNRPRFKGVVEKCTFCLHRTRSGRMPACLEACPTGARKFGNLQRSEQRDPQDHRDRSASTSSKRSSRRSRAFTTSSRETEDDACSPSSASSPRPARAMLARRPRLLPVARVPPRLDRARRRSPTCTSSSVGLVATNMVDQVPVGRLHRELHLPRRDGGRRGDARHPRVRLPRPRAARGRRARRAARRRRADDVPDVRDGRHRAAGSLLAPASR